MDLAPLALPLIVVAIAALHAFAAARNIRRLRVLASPSEATRTRRQAVGRSRHTAAMTVADSAVILLLGAGGVGAVDVAWQRTGLAPLAAAVGVLLTAAALLGIARVGPVAYRRLAVDGGSVRDVLPELASRAAAAGAQIVLLGAAAWWLMQQELWWLGLWALWLMHRLAAPTVQALALRRHRMAATPPDSRRDTRLRGLAARCGLGTVGLEVIASTGARHANARVMGWGPRRKVMVNDALVALLSPAELDAVVGHELGHLAGHHVLKYCALESVLLLPAFAAFAIVREAPWLASAAAGDTLSTGGQLVVLMMMAWVVHAAAGPLLAAMARRFEHEADAFAAGVASRSALATALVKLADNNLSAYEPDPFYSLLFDKHPPLSQRLGGASVRRSAAGCETATGSVVTAGSTQHYE